MVLLFRYFEFFSSFKRRNWYNDRKNVDRIIAVKAHVMVATASNHA